MAAHQEANPVVRLLVVEPRNLYPTDSGAKILSSNLLRHLCVNHEIVLVVNVDPREPPETVERMRALCSELITVPWHELRNFTPRFYAELARCLVTGEVYAVRKFSTPALRAAAASAAERHDVDAIVCDTISAFMPDAFGDPPARPVVALDHNIEYRLRERQAAQATGLKAAYLRYYGRKTREFELDACRRATQVATVSAADADALRREHGIEHVTALPPGVDTDYFRPTDDEADEPELVFTGSMDWQANQAAVLFFAREVLPAVKAAVPDVRFTIVGRRPPASVRALGEADPAHVTVTGTVDDVRPYLSRAPVAVVPVLFGSGVKLKVFEAMAAAKPVVLSSIGAEGLPIRHEEHALIVDGAEAMAAACVRLLGDAGLRRRLGAAARTLVAENYDWSVVAEALAQVCEAAALAPKGPHDDRR
jgi:glycosyltransferase involved in cell wall biosynthesis